MFNKEELNDIMFAYFKYRMHKDYPLCHEVACIALALHDYGFKPTVANIAQVDFFLQREHMYPEVYAARLRAASFLGNNMGKEYQCLWTKEYLNKMVLEEALEGFEL